MSRRHTNAMGGRFVHEVALDRNRVRNTGARFVRPEGEPSILRGCLACALVLVGAVAFIAGCGL